MFLKIKENISFQTIFSELRLSKFHIFTKKKKFFICQSPCETKSIFLYQNSHLIQSNLPQVFHFCFISSQWIWSCKSPRNAAFEEEKWTITKWKQFPTTQNWVFTWHGEWHLMLLILFFYWSIDPFYEILKCQLWSSLKMLANSFSWLSESISIKHVCI